MTTKLNKNLNSIKFDPYYITGFTQADGCFHIALTFNKKMKLGIRCTPKFIITQHNRESNIIYDIKSYFKVGHITKGRNEINYIVNSLQHLNQVIIPHFNNYPLIAGKKDSFNLFKTAVILMNEKKHLSSQGLTDIIELAYSLNPLGKRSLNKKRSLITTIKSKDNLIHEKNNVNINLMNPIVTNKVQIIKEGNYHSRLNEIDFHLKEGLFISGLTDGDGSFIISFKDKKITPSFSIIQDINSKPLLYMLQTFFGCGFVYHYKSNYARFTVENLNELLSKIIPHFLKYPLLTSKMKVFNIFQESCIKLDNKTHLTQKGFKEIIYLAYNMNNEGRRRKLTLQEYLTKIKLKNNELVNK